MAKAGRWTHESVVRLAGDRDPVAVVTERARELVTRAMDAGWAGPPFDPLALATDFLRLELVASADVQDARTVPTPKGARIEFNPNRPRGRRRYSVAHEIAHTLFPDCADRVRNRGSHHAGAQPQDWQLETLCNIGAAEILMPMGSLPALSTAAFSIDVLSKVRAKFDVSMEAVLLRAVYIADFSCGMFVASRVESGNVIGRYRLEYVIGSPTWAPTVARGHLLPQDSVVGQCTAIGFTAKGDEAWAANGETVRVECMGIPAFPGSAYPRVAGVLIAGQIEAIRSQFGTRVLHVHITGRDEELSARYEARKASGASERELPTYAQVRDNPPQHAQHACWGGDPWPRTGPALALYI